jgi:hypothetical protein
MMMATPTMVRGIASNLSSLSDDEIQTFLDLAKAWVGEAAWGSKYPVALAYMAAHLATLSSQKGAGQMTSESVGPVSKSYASHGGSGDELSTTSYGATFLSLRKSIPMTPLMRGPYG